MRSSSHEVRLLFEIRDKGEMRPRYDIFQQRTVAGGCEERTRWDLRHDDSRSRIDTRFYFSRCFFRKTRSTLSEQYFTNVYKFYVHVILIWTIHIDTLTQFRNHVYFFISSITYSTFIKNIKIKNVFFA